MNRKQFIILLVLVAVIGAAGLFVRQHSQDSWQSSGTAIGQKLLPGLPVNDIMQITIKAGTNELNLVKRDNLWRVRERSDYPANYAQISEALIKLADLKVAQSEEIGQSQLARFELLPAGAGPNTATSVEFKAQNGTTTNWIMLGKKHLSKPPKNPQFAGMGDEGWPDGRYVMTGTGAKKLLLISDPLDTLQPKPEQWLSKDFFSIEKPRSVAVQFPEATNSWKLTRAAETNEWQLVGAKTGEKLDSSKISSVTSPFSSPSFNDVVTANSVSATSKTVLTVETFDGFNYVAKIAPKQNENYPVTMSVTANLATERPAAKDEKPDDKAKLDKAFKDQQSKLADKLAREKAFAGWVYHLPAYSVDEILKPRQQLLAEVNTNSAAQTPK